MRVWFAAFGVLIAAAVVVGFTGISVARGTLHGAGLPWLALVLAGVAAVMAVASVLTPPQVSQAEPESSPDGGADADDAQE